MKSLPQIIQSLAFSVVLCMMSMGAEFSGKVVKIVDGDTMDIMRDGAPVRVRLDGIDAPEKAQAWAEKSRKGLEAMTAGKIVSCTYKKSDRYERILGRIKVQGVDVNRAMIKQGLAWHFVKYNKELELANDELAARKAKLGLWADPAPVAPWDYRAQAKAK